MLKLVMCVKRRAHLTREEFDHYWRNNMPHWWLNTQNVLVFVSTSRQFPWRTVPRNQRFSRQEIHCPSILMVAPSCGGTVWNRILQPEKQKKD
ncbi:ethyl tert-butyl ether degradation EthD [Salmonella enterica subsp. enterica serovar Typhimurium]|nr:ethyl tert-butyl ether degradation EthD [Salmonella enterica subsp. enterica serovar Typhimurium]